MQAILAHNQIGKTMMKMRQVTFVCSTCNPWSIIAIEGISHPNGPYVGHICANFFQYLHNSFGQTTHLKMIMGHDMMSIKAYSQKALKFSTLVEKTSTSTLD
jgi:hypothetical protein